jgi:hypothetical protein
MHLHDLYSDKIAMMSMTYNNHAGMEYDAMTYAVMQATRPPDPNSMISSNEKHT